MLTLVIAAAHPQVRASLRMLFELLLDGSHITDAATAPAALALAHRLEPNVLLLDLALPALDAPTFIRRVHATVPRTRVVALAVFATAARVGELVEAGAAAVVLKESAPSELRTALAEVAAGRRYLSPPVARLVQTTEHERGRDAPPDA